MSGACRGVNAASPNVAVCDGGRVTRKAECCALEDCDLARTTKSDFCERHSHDWIAAAEVPIENRIVAGAVRRAQVTLDEGTWVRVLDVYCGTCRQPFASAKGTPCDPYSTVLRGGPIGVRKKREDAPEAL